MLFLFAAICWLANCTQLVVQTWERLPCFLTFINIYRKKNHVYLNQNKSEVYREIKMKSETENKHLMFSDKNYKMLLACLGIIMLGFLLMSGGGAESNEEFNREIFSFRRISLAPTVLLLGYGLVIAVIMKKPSQNNA